MLPSIGIDRCASVGSEKLTLPMRYLRIGKLASLTRPDDSGLRARVVVVYPCCPCPPAFGEGRSHTGKSGHIVLKSEKPSDLPGLRRSLEGGVLLSNEFRNALVVLLYFLTGTHRAALARGEQLAPQLAATEVSRPGRKRPTSEEPDDGIRRALSQHQISAYRLFPALVAAGTNFMRFDNACSS